MVSAVAVAQMRANAKPVYWKPYQGGTMMAVTMGGSGKTASGLVAAEHSDRWHYLAAVLRTNNCRDVAPGDAVLFELGQAEILTDHHGEQFCILRESCALDVLPGYLAAVGVDSQAPGTT